MKVFIFLTLIAFSSAATIELLVRDTVDEIQDLQDETFSNARADIKVGIDHIVGILGDSSTETPQQLYTILEEGIAVAHDLIYNLIDAIRNNGDVKAQAKSTIENIQAHVGNQFGVFEQRAVRDAGDKEKEIHDYIQQLIPECLNNLIPLFNRMQQLAE